jgi:hypothetical protein
MGCPPLKLNTTPLAALVRTKPLPVVSIMMGEVGQVGVVGD